MHVLKILSTKSHEIVSPWFNSFSAFSISCFSSIVKGAVSSSKNTFSKIFQSNDQIQRRRLCRPLEWVVRTYFIDFIPRSLHIFLARLSLISVCLGIDERLFWLGFHHHE